MLPMLLAAVLTAPWPNVALNPITGGFASPTQVTSAHDGSGRLFVVEQAGREEATDVEDEPREDDQAD